MSIFSIRLLKETDTNHFRTLRLKSLEIDPLSWHSSTEEENNLPDSFFANKIRNAYYPPIFGYYGYFSNDKLLAYAQIATNYYNKKRHIATLYDVVVSAEARRQSVGSKLIAFIIDKTKSIGFVEQIHLIVTSKNSGAINFYKNLGFVKSTTIKDAVKEKDGTYQDEFEFVLKI